MEARGWPTSTFKSLLFSSRTSKAESWPPSPLLSLLALLHIFFFNEAEAEKKGHAHINAQQTSFHMTLVSNCHFPNGNAAILPSILYKGIKSLTETITLICDILKCAQNGHFIQAILSKGLNLQLKFKFCF